MRQKRTYIGFALAAVLPIIFVVSRARCAPTATARTRLFLAQVTQSGLATPRRDADLHVGLLPAADRGPRGRRHRRRRGRQRHAQDDPHPLRRARPGDDGEGPRGGDLRRRRVSRSPRRSRPSRGVVVWGFRPLTSLSGTVVSAPKALLLIAAANAVYLVPAADRRRASGSCSRRWRATAPRPSSARSA